MRRAAIVLLAVVAFGAPAVSRADSLNADSTTNESQNPREYTDEDSHPLRIVSYFVTPIGFMLEWTVARPLHYLATDTFLAPAFDSEYQTDGPPAPIAELPPPDYLPRTEPVPRWPSPHHESLTPMPSRSPAASTSGPPIETQPLGPPAPSSYSSQPIIH